MSPLGSIITLRTQGSRHDITRPYSIEFKQWLREARSLPFVASDSRMDRIWTVEQKARVVAESSKLAGNQLTAYLEALAEGDDTDGRSDS